MIKVTVIQDEMDMSAFDEMLTAMETAKVCVDKTKETVIPRLIMEGRAKYDAIMEQCETIAKRGMRLAQMRRLENKTAVIVLQAYCPERMYNSPEFEIRCTADDYYINYDGRTVVFTETLATNPNGWLVNWNQWGVAKKLLDTLQAQTKLEISILNTEHRTLIKTEEDMLN